MAYLNREYPEVTKKILEEGKKGGLRGQRFDQVSIEYVMKTGDGILVSSSELDGKNWVFKIGDEQIMKGMNIAMCTMYEQEKAEFVIPPLLTYDGHGYSEEGPCPYKDSVHLTVKLVEIDRSKKLSKWDLAEEEKLPYTLQFKETGNKLFREGKYQEAAVMYEQAIDFVEWDKRQDCVEAKVLCLYNCGLTYAHLRKFASAIDKVKWSIGIKPKEAKGYCRMSTIFLQMGEHERALGELKKAAFLDPMNEDIREMQKKVIESHQKYFRDSNKMYRGIFNKNVYESRARCLYSDNLNPLVELEARLGEEVLPFKIELFSNLMPDTVNHFLQLVQALLLDKYVSGEAILGNFIYFDYPGADFPLEPRAFENKSQRIKDGGYVFFKADSTGKYCSQFGISMSPLPWFEDIHVPCGFVCVPGDFQVRLEQFISAKGERQITLHNCSIY